MSGLPALRRSGRAVQAVAGTIAVALLVVVGRALATRGDDFRYPAPVLDKESAPIASEEGVFRTRAGDLAVAPGHADARSVHVRSAALYRRTRAYPGAPPRVPHALTDAEYTGGRCDVCHLRGGWVARFGSYAPVTPHAEYGACLQCHAVRDELVGRSPPPPGASASAVCSQCHVEPGVAPSRFVATDWRSSSWPTTDLRALPGSPHLIPHDVQSRSNCVACHAGPGAVEGLRTDHADRENCLQCHVPVAVP